MVSLVQAVLYKERKRIMRYDSLHEHEFTLLAPAIADLSVLKISLPHYSVGQEFFFSDEDEFSDLNFGDMRKLALNIVGVSLRRGEGWFPSQKVKYVLKRDSELGSVVIPLDFIPQSHALEYDRSVNRVRLLGKNVSSLGVGGWVYL